MRNDELTQAQIDTLEDALAMMAAGVPLEEVLAQAGPDAGWLWPMLTLAGEVEALGEAIALPPPDVSLQRLLAHGNALRRAERLAPRPVEPRANFFHALRQRLFRGGLSVATVAALVTVICLLGGTVSGGLVLAAENSLPGQALYPVKRLGETIRLRLAGDEQDRQRLEDTFSTLRRQEVEQLLNRNWSAKVVLTGQVQSFSASKLLVDQLEVWLTPETNVLGEVGVGAKVQIEGETDSTGQLTAGTVTVIEPAPPTPTPTPSPTSTPSPTATPAFKATSDTLIIEPTSTPLAQPTGAGSDNDNNRPEEDDDRSDNSGSGSDNSGRGSDSNRNENNSGSDNDNIEREDDEPKVPPDNSDDNDNQSNEAPKPDETPEAEDNANTNDNVDSGNDDSGSSDNSGSGSDNSGSGNNSGGGGGDNDNNSGSGSDNSGSGNNSGGGGGDNDNNSGSDSNSGGDDRSSNDSGDDDDDE